MTFVYNTLYLIAMDWNIFPTTIVVVDIFGEER